MATTEASIVGVMTVILIIIPGLFLNGMFLFMYGRRQRLRIPAVYFFVSLCVCNFLCIFFWIVPTMMAEFGYTIHLSIAAPLNGYCQFQAVLVIFYQSLHMHTFCLLALERVLKFFKPTLHAEVFYNDAVIIVALVVMWLLEIIPGLFHIMTWGVVVYQTEQYQCTYDDTQATSRLNAMFMYTYIIPFLFTSICFLCVFIKYCLLKNNSGISPGFQDDDVYEEDLTGAGGKKTIKGDRSKRNLSNDDDDSDDEDAYNKLFAVYHEDANDKESNRVQERIYKYRQRELDFALLVFFCWLIYLGLWILYIVIIYMKAYDPTIITTPAAMPVGLETAGTFLSHLSMSLLACLYWIVNRRYRRHLNLACNCGDNTPRDPKPQKIHPRPEPSYNEPVYRRGPGGPQFKNIHRGSLGEFTNSAAY